MSSTILDVDIKKINQKFHPILILFYKARKYTLITFNVSVYLDLLIHVCACV